MIYTLLFWSAGYSESCFAMIVKFITVVTLALVSVHSFVIGVGTLLGV